MADDETPIPSSPLSLKGTAPPRCLAEAGPHTQERFLEFFTANIRNKNTRRAYAHAVRQRYRFFSYGDAMWITAAPAARASGTA